MWDFPHPLCDLINRDMEGSVEVPSSEFLERPDIDEGRALRDEFSGAVGADLLCTGGIIAAKEPFPE